MFKIRSLLTQAFGTKKTTKSDAGSKPGKRRRLLLLFMAFCHVFTKRN